MSFKEVPGDYTYQEGKARWIATCPVKHCRKVNSVEPDRSFKPLARCVHFQQLKEPGTQSAFLFNLKAKAAKCPGCTYKTSDLDTLEKHRGLYCPAVRKKPCFTFELFESGAPTSPYSIAVRHGKGLLFGESCQKKGVNQLMKKLPEITLDNIYVNQHAWPEYALEDRFMLESLQAAFRILKKSESKEPNWKTELRPVSVPVKYRHRTSRENRVQYRIAQIVWNHPGQTSLFKFFPPNQSWLEDFFVEVIA